MFSSLSCATSWSLGFRCSPPLRTPTLDVASSLPPLSNLHPISCNSGLTGAASSSARRRAPVVFASDSDSSSSGPEASAKGKVNNKSNEAAAGDGPPLLTVLAAVVVFLLFCWIVGSIVVWLVGLITNVPRS